MKPRDRREPMAVPASKIAGPADVGNLETRETEFELSGGTSPPTRARSTRRGRKSDHQPELNLFPASRGRFDNTPATIHQNENLDEPTFLRRNLVLN